MSSPKPVPGTHDGQSPPLEAYIERDHYEQKWWAYARLVDLERYVSGGLLVAVFGVILFQIFTRYVLNMPLPWSEEIARLLVVWLTFVGAGFVASRNAHIAVDILAVYLPRRLATASQIIAMLLVVAASAYMVWAAISLMVLTRALTMTATGLPMPLLYGAVLVGYLMILGHTALNIVLYLRHPAEIPDAVEKTAAMEGL
ncbi:TRAP transporter small permease [Brachybacterium sp. YJGR34]|uniref:TRAP transporter small permease n=1 Tax=Brachybacterium sp. YJGR34 TaxID=2059911 RepID=UPI000E0A8AB9|nr:TRAP transporter small permease [Brachybacterium sp. YJGR34]